jgi:hypothetical protein
MIALTRPTTDYDCYTCWYGTETHFTFSHRRDFADTRNRAVEKKLNAENRPGWLYEPARSLTSAPVRLPVPVPRVREAKRNSNWYDRNRVNGGDE